MAGKQLHKLSARKVETITEPGRHSDGGRLYLAIETVDRARRAWVFMYRERGTGRRKELGLGGNGGFDSGGGGGVGKGANGGSGVRKIGNNGSASAPDAAGDGFTRKIHPLNVIGGGGRW
jgi:hypothetical protein